jgi:hypothetical protein
MVCEDEEPVLFFSASEEVLDNAAGQCVFNNQNLVHSTTDVTYKNAGVRGVNTSAACCLKPYQGCRDHPYHYPPVNRCHDNQPWGILVFEWIDILQALHLRFV